MTKKMRAPSATFTNSVRVGQGTHPTLELLGGGIAVIVLGLAFRGATTFGPSKNETNLTAQLAQAQAATQTQRELARRMATQVCRAAGPEKIKDLPRVDLRDEWTYRVDGMADLRAGIPVRCVADVNKDDGTPTMKFTVKL